ncbi:MAG: hypothetical protein A2W61_08530 [Deltaproteobacteria bacterium RIFCSPLOWO2_01_44_7]|nr:MAG: hypothetical protein A2712_11025 [Deltaproteobacteria bacterium RIFCSPHIGHO2_01_FULL_43_49]OGQ16584.1 MAG: hypothetical protein A3D22_06725 [Deltaproteobacteria bacterium RIFCSPHIGHO2_02_FULL_44_53]OGQ28400.1 MAG: hypothetical protein A3D98_06430 [Deltaproteobacteria bacterium RIFCSPHIGHO2_12_FULL_44_21]OGQ32471.1 MAG: hypothetical protein A2979_10990 [Deltaproteobacteria bacterium RIFCSPLOWO2_01_FULL_45_74]OGQ39125.1 MAG: hypothetical protein A2W61_08530 [Deltaproteobacteria bacterium 
MKMEEIILLEKYRAFNELPSWLRERGDIAEQICSIRELLGMTQKQLGERSGGDGRGVRRLEANVLDPRLGTLKKIASGLECELLIAFVPKKSLQAILQEKALKKARHLIGLSKASAAMEKQQPKKKYIKQQIQEMVRLLLEKKRSSLWDD